MWFRTAGKVFFHAHGAGVDRAYGPASAAEGVRCSEPLHEVQDKLGPRSPLPTWHVPWSNRARQRASERASGLRRRMGRESDRQWIWPRGTAALVQRREVTSFRVANDLQRPRETNPVCRRMDWRRRRFMRPNSAITNFR
jgi:hypothetical protein